MAIPDRKFFGHLNVALYSCPSELSLQCASNTDRDGSNGRPHSVQQRQQICLKRLAALRPGGECEDVRSHMRFPAQTCAWSCISRETGVLGFEPSDIRTYRELFKAHPRGGEVVKVAYKEVYLADGRPRPTAKTTRPKFTTLPRGLCLANL